MMTQWSFESWVSVKIRSRNQMLQVSLEVEFSIHLINKRITNASIPECHLYPNWLLVVETGSMNWHQEIKVYFLQRGEGITLIVRLNKHLFKKLFLKSFFVHGLFKYK